MIQQDPPSRKNDGRGSRQSSWVDFLFELVGHLLLPLLFALIGGVGMAYLLLGVGALLLLIPYAVLVYLAFRWRR